MTDENDKSNENNELNTKPGQTSEQQRSSDLPNAGEIGYEETLATLSKQHAIKIDLLREMTEADIYYLIYQCPFLQVVNTQARLGGLNAEVSFIKSDSHWNILDYGDAMSSSAAEFLFASGEALQKINPGKGTLINQAFVTATQMVDMAKQMGWAGVRLIDGHVVMVRAAWIRAQQLGLSFENFTPTQDDLRVADRIMMSSGEMEVLRSEVSKQRRLG